jgi:hypothetical protein
MDTTLRSGGMEVTMVIDRGYIVVPLDVTVDVTAVNYLYLHLDHPNENWNWALDYTVTGGTSGSISGSSDFNVDGYSGNFNQAFPLAEHFDFRIRYDPNGIDIDYTNVHFHELRFFSNTSSGTRFRIRALSISSLRPPAAMTETMPDTFIINHDLLREVNWNNQSDWAFTLQNDGMTVSKLRNNRSVTIPINITVNVAEAGILYLALEHPGVEWDWSLDYINNHGITGTVGAKYDFNLQGHYGNFNNGFPIRNHFNWRIRNDSAFANTDITKIRFTAIHFSSAANQHIPFRIAVLALVSQLPVSPPTEPDRNEPIFSELPPGWAQNAVEFSITHGFLPEDLQKNYNANISRLDFCRLAIAFIQFQTGLSINDYLSLHNVTRPAAFADCDHSDVLAAAALGIVNGTDTAQNLFSPNASIDRQSAARMLTLTCQVLGANVQNPPANNFADFASINSWARPYVDFMLHSGVMTGATETEFRPRNGYTIATSIVTFYRVLQNVNF